MTRTKRFIAGTIAGYGNVAANIVFTLASVPLALAFLDKEQFGLWALAAQVNGYLILLEMGMGNATNRYIADHKDDVNGGTYGSYLLTSGLVYLIQGCVIAAVGFGLSWLAPSLFSIPSRLVSVFQTLVALLAGVSGLSIASRAIGSPLWAFQRMDVINYGFTILSLSFLGFLWIGFSWGLGVVAFPLAQLPATIAVSFIYFWVCKKNGYYPKSGSWGKPCFSIFREIFSYGRDVFLIQIGSQLVNASQIIIISRFVGLGAAATYAIGTKVFMMAKMLLSAPASTAIPILTELYVRQENETFKKRFKEILSLSIAIAAIVASGIALSNRAFIDIWTNGKINWTWQLDILLAAILIAQSYTLFLNSIFAITKNLKVVRYTYFIEGLVFVILAAIVAKPYGITGVLSASLVTHVLCTAVWFNKAAQKFIGKTCPSSLQITSIIFLLITAAFINFIMSRHDTNSYYVMLTNIPLVVIACFIVWKLILDQRIKLVILTKVRAIIS